MLKASAEEHGTVAALAALSSDLNEVHSKGGTTLLKPWDQETLPLFMFQSHTKMINFWWTLMVKFLTYSILTRTSITRASQCIYFIQMQWFKCWDGERENIWDMLSGVGMWLWELEEYVGLDTLLPTLVDPAWILNHISLKMVHIGINCKKVWATVDLVKVHI
ncbi:hypothetical protein V8B97DRAFT_1919642 [Scleroderma yunnanense]